MSILARAGNGFVTFEDKDAANRALELHGTQYRDTLLIVQPESEAAMPLPIVAVKRDINFPKPSIGRGTPQYKSAISNSSYRSSNSGENLKMKLLDVLAFELSLKILMLLGMLFAKNYPTIGQAKMKVDG